MFLSDDLEEIKLGVGLDDSEEISYQFLDVEDKLVMQIKTWNNKFLEINFIGNLLFFEKKYLDISIFCINKSETNLWKEAVQEIYNGKIPSECPYKLFQFLDATGKVVIEIIARDFNFKLRDY